MAYTGKQWLDIGPCAIVWNSVEFNSANADNPDGGTFGGVEVGITADEKEALRDAIGSNPYDIVVIGMKTPVKVPLTGMSLKQLVNVIPGAALSAGATDKSLTINTAAGTSLRGAAAQLTIKPIINGAITTDESKWIIAALAAPSPQINIKFDYQTQKIYEVMFHVFSNLTTGAMMVMGKNVA
jgi:hypothetical protein